MSGRSRLTPLQTPHDGSPPRLLVSFMELLALNEELNASNDELKIANEDPNKVNTQLKEKIVDLH